MQLLVEEFFKKVFDYINGMNLFFIRWVVKFIFYVVLSGLIAYIILSTLKHNYFPVFILLGILLIGEIAHYLRKSREKVMVGRATEKNSVVKKPENKVLLKIGGVKNKVLLGGGKVVEKRVIGGGKKVKVVGRMVKGGGKKVKVGGKVEKGLVGERKKIKKHSLKKIDKALIKPEKAKNKVLLKVNKPKNDDMLKRV